MKHFILNKLGNCWKCFELQQDNVDTLNWLSNNTHSSHAGSTHLGKGGHPPPFFHDAEKTFCDWVNKHEMIFILLLTFFLFSDDSLHLFFILF